MQQSGQHRYLTSLFYDMTRPGGLRRRWVQQFGDGSQSPSYISQELNRAIGHKHARRLTVLTLPLTSKRHEGRPRSSSSSVVVVVMVVVVVIIPLAINLMPPYFDVYISVVGGAVALRIS